MGDFCKGLDIAALPQAVQAGIANHRAVDAFTDRHPRVLSMKPLFSSRRRRFAPVVLDMLFDHLLIRHWQIYSHLPLDEFVHQSYHALNNQQALMPPRMQQVTQLMIRDDWLGSYRQLANVGMAMDRIARRIRFENQFDGAIHEVEKHFDSLESGFLQFYPELVAHTRQLNLEG